MSMLAIIFVFSSRLRGHAISLFLVYFFPTISRIFCYLKKSCVITSIFSYHELKRITMVGTCETWIDSNFSKTFSQKNCCSMYVFSTTYVDIFSLVSHIFSYHTQVVGAIFASIFQGRGGNFSPSSQTRWRWRCDRRIQGKRYRSPRY